MNANASMRSLLEQHAICMTSNNCFDDSHPIWQKTDSAGRKYWGFSAFWGLDQHPIHEDQDLSRLEWDGNEVCLEAQSDEEMTQILRRAIGIVCSWKRELEAKYPDVPFCILASYDNGDLMIDDEESPCRSVTLRFWADRGDNTVLDLDDFENWAQPALIERCNV